MNLAFTPEELAFREEIRAWVKANLPADISQKVHSAMRLTRDDMQRWAKILGKKGWLGWGWPEQFGGPGWNAVQKHLFEEECALAGAPRVVPFGPVMVAPVIMAFGNAEQQQRFLPGIASGEVWWSSSNEKGKSPSRTGKNVPPNRWIVCWSGLVVSKLLLPIPIGSPPIRCCLRHRSTKVTNKS